MGHPPLHGILRARCERIQPRPMDWAPSKSYREVFYAGMFAGCAAYKNKLRIFHSSVLDITLVLAATWRPLSSQRSSRPLFGIMIFASKIRTRAGVIWLISRRFPMGGRAMYPRQKGGCVRYYSNLYEFIFREINSSDPLEGVYPYGPRRHRGPG